MLLKMTTPNQPSKSRHRHCWQQKPRCPAPPQMALKRRAWIPPALREIPVPSSMGMTGSGIMTAGVAGATGTRKAGPMMTIATAMVTTSPGMGMTGVGMATATASMTNPGTTTTTGENPRGTKPSPAPVQVTCLNAAHPAQRAQHPNPPHPAAKKWKTRRHSQPKLMKPLSAEESSSMHSTCDSTGALKVRDLFNPDPNINI